MFAHYITERLGATKMQLELLLEWVKDSKILNTIDYEIVKSFIINHRLIGPVFFKQKTEKTYN